MQQLNQDKYTQEILNLIAQNKEKTAFNGLVKNYNQQLYWHIRRIVIKHDDANDVLQNTYIKIWKSLKKFKGKSKIYTWLYRIATNESLTFVKKQKHTISIEDVELKETQTSNQSVLMDSFEIQHKLELAIATLPPKQRAIFNLKYYEELKYDEISQITSTSVGALKASYHIAVKKIETFLKIN